MLMSSRRDRPPRRIGRIILRALGVVLALLLILAGVVIYRALTFGAEKVAAEPVEKIPLDAAALAERLARAIRFRTISTPAGDGDGEAAQFAGLRAFLQESFPRVHARLEPEL